MSDFNPADLAAIQQANVSAEAVEANRRAVEAKAEAAFGDLGKIIASTDTQLNAQTPAALRTLARSVRLLLRLATDRYEGTD